MDNQMDTPEREIEFTIDGRSFSITDANQTTTSLLELADLDPKGYSLGELHGDRPEPKKYSDGQKVRVQDGDRFVSIRKRATVA